MTWSILFLDSIVCKPMGRLFCLIDELYDWFGESESEYCSFRELTRDGNCLCPFPKEHSLATASPQLIPLRPQEKHTMYNVNV